jgi:muramoyltetrapeptide carboxypeptidase
MPSTKKFTSPAIPTTETNTSHANRNIAIVALSGAIADHTVLDRAASYFAGQGYTVTSPEATWAKFQRFAGTDQERLDALHQVVADKSVDIVMAARGGYGLTRLMADIKWKKLADSGKRFIGYSDFTAMNLALLATTGTASLHGPSAVAFGGEVISSFTEDHFWPMIETGTLNIKVKGLANEAKQPKVETNGILWGGNLAMFCALLGTPYMPAIKNGILFFEDVSEHPYRIERMLLQLKQAGILDKQRAIVLGQFTDYKLNANDNGYNLDAVIAHMRTITKTPILTGLPFGHVSDKATLPYGSKVQLKSTAGGLTLLG